jgi:hypothetical protein
MNNQAYISDIVDPSMQLGKLIDFVAIFKRIEIKGSTFKDNLARFGTPNLYFFDSSDV